MNIRERVTHFLDCWSENENNYSDANLPASSLLKAISEVTITVRSVRKISGGHARGLGHLLTCFLGRFHWKFQLSLPGLWIHFFSGGFIGYQQHPLTLRPRWKQMFDPSAAAMDLANNATAIRKSFG